MTAAGPDPSPLPQRVERPVTPVPTIVDDWLRPHLDRMECRYRAGDDHAEFWLDGVLFATLALLPEQRPETADTLTVTWADRRWNVPITSRSRRKRETP